MDSHHTELNLAEQAARLLGAVVLRVTPVAGGDLSQVVLLELDDGRTIVAKGGSAPGAEAEMLAAIRATGASAPAVLAHDDSVLALEYLPSGGRLEDAWHELGNELSKLHRAADGDASRGAQRSYGWHRDYAFGPVDIPNEPTNDWPSFWVERRLVNQASYIAADLARRTEILAADIPNRLPASPPMSLLHGDLWSGNILVADGRISGVIDPACYYGDGEVDLAMLRLFTTLDARLFDSYGQLAAGHEERLPIYQLWPALVHLRLFGETYRGMVERMLSASGV